MEERETIPRREAVVGLGLLGLLTAAMVGTVAYRIVHSAPRKAPQTTATVWASQGPASAVDGSSASEPQLAAEQFPAAAPIPTVDDGSSSVPATSTTESAPIPIEPVAAPVQSPPHFVAPSRR